MLSLGTARQLYFMKETGMLAVYFWTAARRTFLFRDFLITQKLQEQ